jgi:hypothetical protein
MWIAGLPAGMRTLFQRGPYPTTVQGRVFPDPGLDTNIAQVLINGRRVGRGLCGGGSFPFVY